MASYGGELLLDSSFPWSGVSSLSSFSIPLPFIFQEAKESIDEEDPRPTSSNGAYITYLLTRMSESDQQYIDTLEIEPRKLSRNSNSPKFSLGYLIQEQKISRCLKLNVEAHGKFKRP